MCAVGGFAAIFYNVGGPTVHAGTGLKLLHVISVLPVASRGKCVGAALLLRLQAWNAPPSFQGSSNVVVVVMVQRRPHCLGAPLVLVMLQFFLVLVPTVWCVVMPMDLWPIAWINLIFY